MGRLTFIRGRRMALLGCSHRLDALMADSMTPGNRLYIYRLLSEKLGYGKQVTIERA